MSATIPTNVSSLAVSKPSAMVQTSKTDLSPFTASEENHQFTSSFSVRAILSSRTTSQAEASFLSNPFYRHLLFAEDAGQVDYSPFPQHHCCQHGACAVGWQGTELFNQGISIQLLGDHTNIFNRLKSDFILGPIAIRFLNSPLTCIGLKFVKI